MQHLSPGSLEVTEAFEYMSTRLQMCLDTNELTIPLLPEVAVRVVGTGTKKNANAQLLAEIITADASLTMYVLRVATSAAKRPATPIVSLQHALAWLGIDEVANIAFTLALQGKLLHVKGQHRKARRLWRHSLASALWSRQFAHRLTRETGVCYLGGLLHDIGKVVTLGAVNDIAGRERVNLSGEDYDRLIQTFQREIGQRVVRSWSLPHPVPFIVDHWEDYGSADAVQWQCNVVNLAHKFADFTLHESNMLKRDELIADGAYRDLGLNKHDSASIFDSAAMIDDELDRYLAQ